jgi:hypothetical protein
VDEKKKLIERLKHDPSTQELELQKLGFLHEHDTQFKVTGQRITPATKEPKPAKR